MKAALIMENGRVFYGKSIGAQREAACEMVFNTSMVGYQEILTDPSYAGQGIIMSYPLIGNYGVNSDDSESRQPWAQAFVVRHLSPRGSNFRCEGTLNDYLITHNIPGIEGVDTRAIVRMLRDQGTMNGIITTNMDFDLDEMVQRLTAHKMGAVVEQVTCPETGFLPGSGKRVAVLDFGVKGNLIVALQKRDCEITVFPAHTKAETIIEGGFDGVLLTNGPGNPADCGQIIDEIGKLYDSGTVIFAVCLGHQLLALATGARTEKLAYGHRGANHPVRDLQRNNVYITSQNHGYVVVEGTVDPAVAEISHVNVNDGTVEGLVYKNGRAFSTQFHPEASPGPTDTAFLFDRFMDMMV